MVYVEFADDGTLIRSSEIEPRRTSGSPAVTAIGRGFASWLNTDWDPVMRGPKPVLVASLVDLATEFGKVQSELFKKPNKKPTTSIDAILAKSDSLWATADIATVLRWIVSAMREA